MKNLRYVLLKARSISLKISKPSWQFLTRANLKLYVPYLLKRVFDLARKAGPDEIAGALTNGYLGPAVQDPRVPRELRKENQTPL